MKNAFILRISPGGIDKVNEAKESNQIIIGWSHASDLTKDGISWYQFRKLISDVYYKNEKTMRKAGNASGHLWRFIRDMKIGDLVVVPHGANFYVAKIEGDAEYFPEYRIDDTSYRRSVTWLNEKKPISRKLAKAALVSRMKAQGTCTIATDLIPHIEDCLLIAQDDSNPTFKTDLNQILIENTLKEIRTGRVDSYIFEKMIKDVLVGIGAIESKVIPRNQDKGADIIATFMVAGVFPQTVVVQAKHWQPDPPVDKNVVRQLINGIEEESADFGIVITSGTIGDDANSEANDYTEKTGANITLIDGEQFAQLVLEHYLVKSNGD